MIAKMSKVYVAVRGSDSDRLLQALREAGLVHLEPVRPAKAVPEEKTVELIDRIRRALQILETVPPAGSPPDLPPAEAAEQVLLIQRRSAEAQAHLAALRRQHLQLEMWGDARLEQFRQLQQAGLEVQFLSVPDELLSQVQAEFVQVLQPLPGKRSIVAVVDREGKAQAPEQAEGIALPKRDRPGIRQEAAEIEASLKQDGVQMASLAGLKPALAQEVQRLTSQAQYTVASRGGLAGMDLYALQGWVPAEAVEAIPKALARANLEAAFQSRQAAPDEDPPTHITYPRWASPIKGLFEVLGTVPGYREFDVSGFFMIAVPVFAAMLIGDAGYGLLFLLGPLLFYRRLKAVAGSAKTHLLMILGAVTIAWGLVAGNIFGVTPQQLVDAGGALAGAGKALQSLQLIRGDIDRQAQTIMKLSFVLAAVHLSSAQVRRAVAFAPSLKALAPVGWALFLWGMFGIIWYLFFASQASPPLPMHHSVPWLLAIGGAMAILFEAPSRNPAKMLGIGLAKFPLSAMSTFSDTLSYIRLMGVGLASTIIGQMFNSLGAQAAGAATWLAGAPIVLAGHALNVAMCAIAILAHGVRLNMLEFSSNAGIQWAGYPYEPFALAKTKET